VADPEPLTLTLIVPLGRLGKEPGEGSPGIDPAPGRLGSDPAPGRLGSEPAPGRLGSDPAPGSPDPGLLGDVDDDGAEGVAGTEGTDGKEPAEGRLGSPEGLVMHSCTPLVLDAWSDPPPAGELTLPPPERDPGTGIAGAAGVLTH
jgi:hypothetical protein